MSKLMFIVCFTYIYLCELAVCLGLECVPTGDWHCSHCTEKFGPGGKAAGESRPIILRLTRVVKAPEYEAGGCVVCRFVSEIVVIYMVAG